MNKYLKEPTVTSRNLLKVNVSRQIRFVGHVMRKNQLEAVALTGMIEGKRLEEDKGKRSWTGYLPHVEINGTSTKFSKFVKNVGLMSILLIANVKVWHSIYGSYRIGSKGIKCDHRSFWVGHRGQSIRAINWWSPAVMLLYSVEWLDKSPPVRPPARREPTAKIMDIDSAQ